MVYYGARFKSTMCGVESIFIAETETEVEEIVKQFKSFVYDEDESFITNYTDYELQWDSETRDYSFRQLDNGHYLLVSDDRNTYEFIMVENFVERF